LLNSEDKHSCLQMQVDVRCVKSTRAQLVRD